MATEYRESDLEWKEECTVHADFYCKPSHIETQRGDITVIADAIKVYCTVCGKFIREILLKD